MGKGRLKCVQFVLRNTLPGDSTGIPRWPFGRGGFVASPPAGMNSAGHSLVKPFAVGHHFCDVKRLFSDAARAVLFVGLSVVTGAVISSPATAKPLPEFTRARAHAACVLASAMLAKSKGDAVQCWTQRSAALASMKTRRDLKKAPKCAAPIAVKKATRGEPQEENDTITVTEEYLDAVQGRLATLSGRIGRCYKLVGTELKVPPKRMSGQLVVEWTVGKVGDPTQAVVIESSIDPLVSGCVVEALCSLGVDAPPGDEAFVVELPFSFGK